MALPSELTTLANALARTLIDRGDTVGVAESSAGGLVSSSLLTVPGASAYYLGGTVIYTGRARKAFMDGAVDVPEGVRGASEPFAQYLATAVRAKLGCTWGVAETGAAGPSGNPYGDPAGHAWVAVAGPGGVTTAHVQTGDDNREANMIAFARAALDLLSRALSS